MYYVIFFKAFLRDQIKLIIQFKFLKREVKVFSICIKNFVIRYL